MEKNEFYELTFSFNQEQVDLFAQVSGDLNPIHIDKDFASKSMFGSRIIHGFLTGSVFSKIIGMHFPGNGAIYLSQSLKFIKPMFVDLDYTAKVKVLEIIAEKKRFRLETTIYETNSKETTLEGEALIYYNQQN